MITLYNTHKGYSVKDFWFQKNNAKFFRKTEAHILVSKRKQNKNSTLNKLEQTYLTNTSNWMHDAMSTCQLLHQV